MPADWLGNPVTGGDPATIAAIDDFVGGMLAYEARAARIVAAAETAPDHCLANAYAGMLHMLAEAPNAAAGAKPFLLRAEAAMAGVTPREKASVAALAAWVGGDEEGAIAAFDRLHADAPGDLLALKMLHYHLFNHGRFAAMLRAARRAEQALPHIAYVHGMAAFAYEQLHLLGEAEAAARHALALSLREPWAEHALSHVMLTQGRIDEGVDFLEARAAGWTGLNSFMVTHLWWHIALFYMSQGREADALAAYDAQVWGVARDYSQDQIGAVSLLARLEMDGADVGARWDDLAPYLAARAADVVQPFLSVQYLYGLARVGAVEASLLLQAIERRAREAGGVWAGAALPLAQGIVAYHGGRFTEATALIRRATPELVALGGSHAQRDLFDQILLDASIRAGELDAAQQMLELRRLHDPDGVPLNRKLAAVYRALGLEKEAAVADDRASRRSSR